MKPRKQLLPPATSAHDSVVTFLECKPLAVFACIRAGLEQLPDFQVTDLVRLANGNFAIRLEK